MWIHCHIYGVTVIQADRYWISAYNSKDRKTFEIPDELCNGTDIVKVTFRLTVEDLIDSELIQLYPISIVKQILKQEDI